MKTLFRVFQISELLILLIMHSTITSAQVGAPRSSAKTAAQYDAQCLTGNISDIRDILFFLRNQWNVQVICGRRK